MFGRNARATTARVDAALASQAEAQAAATRARNAEKLASMKGQRIVESPRR